MGLADHAGLKKQHPLSMVYSVPHLNLSQFPLTFNFQPSTFIHQESQNSRKAARLPLIAFVLHPWVICLYIPTDEEVRER
jgi:hypothetical protein